MKSEILLGFRFFCAIVAELYSIGIVFENRLIV